MALVTNIEYYDLIKLLKLDFSKRQMVLYRKQGHRLITGVIRYKKRKSKAKRILFIVDIVVKLKVTYQNMRKVMIAPIVPLVDNPTCITIPHNTSDNSKEIKES